VVIGDHFQLMPCVPSGPDYLVRWTNQSRVILRPSHLMNQHVHTLRELHQVIGGLRVSRHHHAIMRYNEDLYHDTRNPGYTWHAWQI
jgi:hypothetical protein